MSAYAADPRPKALVRLQAGKVAGASAAALVAATAIVAQWEGKRNVGYLDIIGVPTYCYGGTGPEAKVGKRYTDAECRSQLAEDVRDHAAPLARCITRPLPDETYAAIVSLSFNIGPSGVCRSSVVRRANAGDIRGACDAISLYDKAGGRVVRGLQNRRKAERALCLRGLP